MSRKSTTVAASSINVQALESSAIEAVKAIESSYGAASAAILAFTLGVKEAKVPAPVFEAGIARIAEAAPGIGLISVRGYVSNARRVYACPSDKLAEVMKTVSGLQSIAKACPAVVKAKAEGATKREADKAEARGDDPKAASTPKVASASADPILALSNALVMLRKASEGKKKARTILAIIASMEELAEEAREMLKAA